MYNIFQLTQNKEIFFGFIKFYCIGLNKKKRLSHKFF